MNSQDYGLSRPSFLLIPEVDCGIFAGRSDVKAKLEGRIRRGLATNTSVHTFIYGDYGSGKTHTLYYFLKYVQEQHGANVLPIFVPQPQVDAASNPSHLYKSIVMALSPVEVFDLFSKIWDTHQDELQKHTELYHRVSILQNYVQDRDLAYVIHKYITSRPVEDYAVVKWLSGEKCTAKEKQMLGVISDNSNPNIAIRTLLSLCQLFNKYEKKYVILLLDELEKLTVLSDKKLTEFESFFRLLVSEQQGIAAVLAQSVEESIENGVRIFLGNTPVGGRIGFPQNYIWLKPFDDPAEAKEFLKELISQLRPKGFAISKIIEKVKKETEETVNEDFFPFTTEAVDMLLQILAESGVRVYPRTIQNSATNCLGEVMSNNKRLITKDIVESVIGL